MGQKPAINQVHGAGRWLCFFFDCFLEIADILVQRYVNADGTIAIVAENPKDEGRSKVVDIRVRVRVGEPPSRGHVARVMFVPAEIPTDQTTRDASASRLYSSLYALSMTTST